MARHSAKVTSKGQVTIPKAIRDQLGLREGDWLVFEPKAGHVEVHKGRIVGDTELEQILSTYRQ